MQDHARDHITEALFCMVFDHVPLYKTMHETTVFRRLATTLKEMRCFRDCLPMARLTSFPTKLPGNRCYTFRLSFRSSSSTVFWTSTWIPCAWISIADPSIVWDWPWFRQSVILGHSSILDNTHSPSAQIYSRLANADCFANHRNCAGTDVHLTLSRDWNVILYITKKDKRLRSHERSRVNCKDFVECIQCTSLIHSRFATER
jgi:hypothetical protein